LAGYTEAVCKLCRREGTKIFLKGDRCYTDKCAFERRSYPPGQHGQGRGKVSEYALQLREKQKVKRMYGLLETQFNNLFKKAERTKGVTGEIMISLLERRLDNVTFRLGFANSRREARILVAHGLMTVNGRKVDIPSYCVKADDLVAVAEAKKKVVKILESLKAVDRRGIPEWLHLEKDNLKGKIMREPVRADVTVPIEEHLIVELYSK
jgi:small subunit ribosomal protein S4